MSRRAQIAAPDARLDAETLAALVDLAHDAVVVRTTPASRIVFWNSGAERLYGWTRDEALGRVSHELLATVFPRPLAEIDAALAATGRWEGELRHATKTGERIVVESRWAHYESSAGLVAIEINRDVTAQLAARRDSDSEAARLRAIFESSLDAILLTAPDGRVLAVNPAAEAMFGFREEELVAGGRDLVVDTTDPRLIAALREREETGRVRADVRGRRRDGSTFEVEVSSVLFEDADGELRTAMIVHDVSERIRAEKALRESEARFQALADAAFEAVFIHERGRIVAANRSARALYGWSADDELGTKMLHDIVPPDELERVRAIIEAGGEGPYETWVIAADGDRIPVEVSARSIVYGGTPMRVTAIRDIGELRRAKQVLEEQNERLREIDAMKSEFVALVSHELRTPLTSIIAYLGVLAAGEAGDELRERRYVEIATRNANRLRRLVDDLLFVHRAEAGEFALELGRVELAPLAEEVVETFAPAADEAGVGLRAVTAAEPVVEGDRERLAQLLDNLVANALKFTPAGGTVEVRVDAAGDAAVLAVADTGEGIAAEDLPRLFERFYRAAAADSKPGAGLGLAIAAEIVAAHRGTIRAESEPGQGSTFVVELPLARAAP